MFRFSRPLRGSLAACAFLVLAVSSSAGMGPHNLPATVHPAFSRAIDRAEKAAQSGDHQFALALLAGNIYPDGITLGFDESSLKGNRAKFTRATQRAMQIWDDVLGGDSPMRYAPQGTKPEITMVLVDELPQGGDVLGLIQMEKKYSWTRRSFKVENKVVISILRAYDDKALTEDQMTEVIAHEMGHLLGLADVDESGPLMGPMDFSKPSTQPMPHEVQAVKQLRQVTRDRIAWVQRDLVARSGK